MKRKPGLGENVYKSQIWERNYTQKIRRTLKIQQKKTATQWKNNKQRIYLFLMAKVDSSYMIS